MLRCWIVLIFLSTLAASAQEFNGVVRPLNTEPRSAQSIEFFALDFQSLAFGREGSSYFGIKTAPVAGREYLVDANVSRKKLSQYGQRTTPRLRQLLV